MFHSFGMSIFQPAAVVVLSFVFSVLGSGLAKRRGTAAMHAQARGALFCRYA